MQRCDGMLAALATIGTLGIAIVPSGASMQSTVDYQFLSTGGKGERVVLLERFEGDGTGTSVCTLSARGESVVWRRRGEWTQADDRRFGTDLYNSTLWGDSPTEPFTHGVSRRISVPELSCTVSAPESLDADADPFGFRPPIVRGARATCIFHKGRGRYVNYALREAVWIPARRWLVVITTSTWQWQKVSYNADVDLGDGVVVFRIARGAHSSSRWRR